MLKTILVGMGITLITTGYVLSTGRPEPSSSTPAVVPLRPASSAQQSSSAASSPVSPQRALINRYCVGCHNQKLKTAELALDTFDLQNIAEDGPVWEKVVRKIRTDSMPPAGMPRPDKATTDSLAAYLETDLDRASAAKPDPGRPEVHRLNRTEYTNAVRDLLGIDTAAIDISSLLPADDSSYGFDNIGDVLTVSPTLMEAYMSAARKISRFAIGDPASRPVFQTYTIPKYVMQTARMSEDLPFRSRGGTAIRHYFPVDGEYIIRIRMQRSQASTTGNSIVLGFAESHQIDLRFDGKRLQVFTVGGGDARERGRTQAEWDAADAGLEVRIPVQAGTHDVGVTFLDQNVEPEGVFQPELTDYNNALSGGTGFSDPDPAIGNVTIAGPYDSKGIAAEIPSRRKIFVCQPTGSNDELACATRILSTLARRAYRGPVADEDLQALLTLYSARRRADASAAGFDQAIQTALQRILVDPEFLFRIERVPANLPAGTAYRISDLELASRLSFFLWSSIPDDELLELAESGRLQDPAILEQQVRRMLTDRRSKALVENFAGQWLYLRNVQAKWPNPETFPDFVLNLREDFQRETELFFESMLREDRSLVDLLRADYTFLNERLARHYGIPNIYGPHFRRVALKDENRQGLLGQGSILMVTSHDTRTAPTIRGKWLLDNVLGAPPPPPPPNVPSLDEKKGEAGKPLSVREQMELHRVNPACASCHKVMDPLGFALENFDATGRWRTTEANNPIDASGVLPDGTRFQGPAELRKILLNHPEQFAHTVTEKLLIYALGRGVEYYDMPAIRKILRDAAPGEYHWSSIILGVVKSLPFQMRRSS